MNSLFVFSVVIFTGLFFDRLNIFKIYIISTILHELGHIFAYCLCLKKWPHIDISLFGYKMQNNVVYCKNYTFILLRGPFINFLIILISLIFLNSKATLTVCVFFSVNLIIFIFNILPVYFLDGGQVLYHLSPFYQRYYIEISIFTVAVLCVMVFRFTHNIISIIIFGVYFVFNILNDI